MAIKMTKQQLIDKLLKKFPAPELYNYSKRLFVEERKQYIVYHKINEDLFNSGALAYCTRGSDSRSSYEVYIPKSPLYARVPLEMHEFGHIIFQHLRFEKFKEKQVFSHIESYWDKFKEYIDIDNKKSVSEQIETKSALIRQIINVAMDMEVNSKLFPTRSERESSFDAIENYVIRNRIEKECETIQDFQKIKSFYDKKKKDPNEKFLKFVDPYEYGYPDGLNYLAYIDLILQEPDKFISKEKEAYEAEFGCGNSNEADGEDSEVGKNASNHSKGKSSNRSKMTSSQLRKLAQKSDMSRAIDALDKYCKSSKGDACFIGNENSYSIKNFDIKHEVSRELSKFIKEICIASSNAGWRQDALYNYNRGKYRSNVIIPKTLENHTIFYGNLFVLIDVSSSVKESAIKSIVNCLIKNKGFLGNDSKVVFWNIGFAGEEKLSKGNFEKIPIGGGTALAAGMYYVGENFIKSSNDKFLVISDFEDYMAEWEEALKTIKCQTFAIQWDNNVEYGIEKRNMFETTKPSDISYGFDTECQYQALKKMNIVRVSMNLVS